jgi:hypothetical protein
MGKINATVVTVLFALATHDAAAQSIEVVGTRALGMAGAFVAVADDATATYWNPGGLPTGATLSALFDGNTADLVPGGDEGAPLTPESRAQRVSGRALALTTPAFGLSYYRIETITLAPVPAADDSSPDREEEIGSPPGTALVLQQYGATLVQSLAQGFNVGTTVKVVHGRAARLDPSVGATIGEALDRTDALEKEGTTRMDLDVGVMIAAGPIRLGAVGRNLLRPEFDTVEAIGDEEVDSVVLERQIRLGVAITPGHFAEAPNAPTTIAFDVDLHHTTGVYGEQRQVAIGAEQWLAQRRVGVRGGVRFNWVRRDERSASVGLSIGIRRGTYVEGQLTRGRDELESGWSVATRTSF